MTEEEFKALLPDIKTLATESYLDGYAAAISTLKSIKIRVGDNATDSISDSTISSAVSILEANYKTMKDKLND